MIRAARKHLAALENQSAHNTNQFDLFTTGNDTTEVEAKSTHPALSLLNECDPDSLSPREALETLYRLKRLSSADKEA